jgi:hypothetical protein
MISRFNIQRHDTDFTQQSRLVMRDQFSALPPGEYTISIEPAKQSRYTSSRYKYYFGHILPCILEKCAARFRMINPRTGEESSPRNTSDLHECLKMMFNPVTVITPNGAFNTPGTTTALSNQEFINEFMELIFSYFSSDPYNVEFLDREDWNAEMKAKHE